MLLLFQQRNEKNVIGNLLDSIKKQDYPKELLTVFVIADNCTDNTAEIARSHGAICYERFDDEHKTKGFALQYLFEKIEEDYGCMSFEGYFVFDADNLLKSDYISRMNDAFDAGEKIITSYRNTKNLMKIGLHPLMLYIGLDLLEVIIEQDQYLDLPLIYRELVFYLQMKL